MYLRKCRKCGVTAETVEDLILFKKHSKMKNGVDSICKECHCTSQKKWQAENIEVVHKYKKEYYLRNSDTIRYKVQSWRTTEIGKELKNANERKRRAKKLEVEENYTKEDSEYTYNLFNERCFNCSATENLCVDHHYPLSKGFALTRTNAVILCRSCNSSKNNKLPEEFYTEEKLTQLVELGIKEPHVSIRGLLR